MKPVDGQGLAVDPLKLKKIRLPGLEGSSVNHVWVSTPLVLYSPCTLSRVFVTRPLFHFGRQSFCWTLCSPVPDNCITIYGCSIAGKPPESLTLACVAI